MRSPSVVLKVLPSVHSSWAYRPARQPEAGTETSWFYGHEIFLGLVLAGVVLVFHP